MLYHFTCHIYQIYKGHKAESYFTVGRMKILCLSQWIETLRLSIEFFVLATVVLLFLPQGLCPCPTVS